MIYDKTNIRFKIICSLIYSKLQYIFYWICKNISTITIIVLTIVGLCFWHFYEINDINAIWYRDFVERYLLVDIAIFIYSIVLFIVSVYYVLNTSKISSILFHTIIIAEIIVSLYYIPVFLPVHLLRSHLYYHDWITILLSLLLTIEIIACYYRKHIVGQTDREKKENKPIHKSWKEYASTIVSHIDTLNQPTESFTFGVIGSWGCGKTTMLNAIKKQINSIGKDYIVREFSPWKMISANQIITEFFGLLQDIISEIPSADSLKKTMLQYALLLTDFSNAPTGVKNILSKLGDNDSKSIITLHKTIDEGLQKLKRRIVIIIDDLDRLDYKELYEVMRLIRVSANFKNILFIVAYDKTYITHTLQSHGMSQADEYLKKIVNMEISLPIFEDYYLGNLLYKKIIESDGWSEAEKNEFYTSIQYRSTVDNRPLIQHYFLNFRDVERFSQYVLLLIQHLNKEDNQLDINRGDLFWLEVLHYFDNKIYDTLRNNMWDILDMSPRADLLVYKKKENEILTKLFSEKIRIGDKSISHINNYRLYFALTKLEDSIPLTEFSSVMQTCESKDSLISQVHKWLGGRQCYSFLHAMRNYYFNAFTNKKEEVNYMNSIILTALYQPYNATREKDMLMLFRALFNSRFDRQEFIDKETLTEELKYIINHFEPSPTINRFLATLTTSIDLNGDDEDAPDKLLNNDDVKVLAETHFKRFKETLEVPDIKTLFNDNNLIYVFVKSSAYIDRYYSEDETKQSTEYTCLLPYAIEEIYSDKKFNEDDFYAMMSPLMTQLEIGEDIIEISSLIQKLYGNTKNFITFINNHFTLSEEMLISYLNSLGLKK